MPNDFTQNDDWLRYAKEYDAKDSLSSLRSEFDIPADKIYLDGNSLGPLPKKAKIRAKEVIEEQWGKDLISSWNRHDWIDLPTRVGDKIGKLIGADKGQTICCDSISVNLFKLLSAAMKINIGRKIILTEKGNFPTDIYMAQGLQSVLGKSNCELVCVDKDQIASSLSEDVSVLMLTHVDFRSGAIHDMKRLTQLAQSKGILVIWDLAHSVGAIPIHLDDCCVDFAVGCGYKYLNGGPGCPAFMYVAKRHQTQFQQPLFGWMGHKNAFAFSPQYEAAEGMAQCMTGTPAILSMSVLDAALDVFTGVDLLQVRQKSIALSEFFLTLMKESNLDKTLRLSSPLNSEVRGSQLAFSHPDAYAICQALISKGVICDFRAPDMLRVGFTPLYTRYEDVYRCVSCLFEIVQNRHYQLPQFQIQSKVT